MMTDVGREQREQDIAEIGALLRLCDAESVAGLLAVIQRRVLQPSHALRLVYFNEPTARQSRRRSE